MTATGANAARTIKSKIGTFEMKAPGQTGGFFAN